MLGETLPKLSACESAAAIAAMGIKGLLIAAGVERAIYIVFHPETSTCEVLVHAVMDDNGQAELRPYPFPATLPAEGLLARGCCRPATRSCSARSSRRGRSANRRRRRGWRGGR